jgi:hypothetical protein
MQAAYAGNYYMKSMHSAVPLDRSKNQAIKGHLGQQTSSASLQTLQKIFTEPASARTVSS